jgi:hypothetical protein
MKSAEEMIAQLAEQARSDGRVTFVSWALRLDCEFVRDLAIVCWRINGRQSSEQQAIAALQRARAGHQVTTP